MVISRPFTAPHLGELCNYPTTCSSKSTQKNNPKKTTIFRSSIPQSFRGVPAGIQVWWMGGWTKLCHWIVRYAIYCDITFTYFHHSMEQVRYLQTTLQSLTKPLRFETYPLNPMKSPWQLRKVYAFKSLATTEHILTYPWPCFLFQFKVSIWKSWHFMYSSGLPSGTLT